MKKGQQFIRYIAVILLQIVMVSPGTHLVKNHESLSITNESQLKTMRWNWKCFGLYVTYYQTVMKTNSKALYYSVLKLKYSPSHLKNNKGWKKYASLNNSHNNCHRNYTNRRDISTNTCTHVQIDRSMDLCVLWDACHELLCIFRDFNASDTQDAEVTEALTLYVKCLPWSKRLPTYHNRTWRSTP